MHNPIIDFNCNSPVLPIPDNMGVDMNGNMHMRISDNMAVDVRTGEVHFTTPWKNQEDDHNEW